MLQYLSIKNYLHVVETEVQFGQGLHCITGESGSGKTLLIKALKLLFGEKPPKHTNEEPIIIEAAFDIATQKEIHTLLEESGIAYDPKEWLLLKRTVPSNGRSRFFVNSQNASLPLGDKLGNLLVEIIDQHAGKQLLSSEYQRRLLDTFGGYTKELEAYHKAYDDHEQALATQREIASYASENIAQLIWQKEELEKHDIPLIDIESELSAYDTYVHSQEIADTLSQSVVTIREHLMPQNLVIAKQIDKMSDVNKDMQPLSEHMQSIEVEYEEAATFAERMLDSLHFDPEEYDRLAKLSSFIASYQRKYGIPPGALKDHYIELNDIVEKHESVSEKRALIEETIQKTEEALEKAADQLSEIRTEAIERLETLVSDTLHTLNMTTASFVINQSYGPRKKHGADIISFELKWDKTKSQPIKQAASGGELSRILLAVKSHIAVKQSTPTLIFDEIDANIGGETANVVADLLKQASHAQQLLTITHFPQVASKADHHIVVEKSLLGGEIRTLETKERKAELLRMVGGDLVFEHKESVQ